MKFYTDYKTKEELKKEYIKGILLACALGVAIATFFFFQLSK